MSRRDLSVKGGTSERCYRTRRGWTDEQRYAIISPYFDGRIKMNGPYPEITNISSLAKLFFKSFISLKHLSDYRTVGLSDRRTIGLSDYRIIATAPCTQPPLFRNLHIKKKKMAAPFLNNKPLNTIIKFFFLHVYAYKNTYTHKKKK